MSAQEARQFAEEMEKELHAANAAAAQPVNVEGEKVEKVSFITKWLQPKQVTCTDVATSGSTSARLEHFDMEANDAYRSLGGDQCHGP